MRDRLPVFSFLAVGLLLAAAPVLAHHGLAEYKMNKLVYVKGVVTGFDYANPHAQIYIETRDAKGHLETWQGEMTSPNMLTRMGWTRSTLHAHEEVTLVGFRSRSGDPILRVQKVLGPDGRELPGNAAHGNAN